MQILKSLKWRLRQYLKFFFFCLISILNLVPFHVEMVLWFFLPYIKRVSISGIVDAPRNYYNMMVWVSPTYSYLRDWPIWFTSIYSWLKKSFFKTLYIVFRKRGSMVDAGFIHIKKPAWISLPAFLLKFWVILTQFTLFNFIHHFEGTV